MPKRVRDLISDLQRAGFAPIKGGGRGAHRKFSHAKYPGAVTLSGHEGDDAKPYQENQVARAIEAVNESE